MPKALADAKKAERKQVEKRVGKPPKHVSSVPPASKAEPPGDGGVDTSAAPVVQSGFSVFNPTSQESIVTEQAATRPSQEAAAEAAQAKIAAKSEKLAAQAAKKAEREAKAAEKAKLIEATKAEREAKKAQRDALLKERAEALKAAGRQYTGSMLSLADRVKQGVYTKAANGQLTSGDELATVLGDFNPADVISICVASLGLQENPYTALNVGQQSMTLRNKVRGKIKAGELNIEGVKSVIVAGGFKTVTSIKEEMAAVREAVKAEKAAEKAAKEAAAKAAKEAAQAAKLAEKAAAEAEKQAA